MPTLTPEDEQALARKARGEPPLVADTDTKVGLQEFYDNIYRKPAADDPITSLESPAEGPVPLKKLDIPGGMEIEATPATATPATAEPVGEDDDFTKALLKDALSRNLSDEYDEGEEDLVSKYRYLEANLDDKVTNKLYHQSVAATPFSAYILAEDRAKNFKPFLQMDKQLKALTKKAKHMENSKAEINWSALAYWAGDKDLGDALTRAIPTKQQKEAMALDLRAKILEARTGLAESKRKFMDDQLTGKFYSGTEGSFGRGIKATNVNPKAPPEMGEEDKLGAWKDFRDYADDHLKGTDSALASTDSARSMLAQGNPVADTAFVAELLKGRKLAPISELEFRQSAQANKALPAQINAFLSRVRTGKFAEEDRKLFGLFLDATKRDLIRERAKIGQQVMKENEFNYPVLGKARMQKLVFPGNYPDAGLEKEATAAETISTPTTNKPITKKLTVPSGGLPTLTKPGGR